MVSAYEVAQYWASAEGQARWPRCIDLGEPSCMACGYYASTWDKQKTAKQRWEKAQLERAHIIAASAGGSDVASNYVMLCCQCHAAAPMTTNGELMLRWCERRKSFRDQRLDSIKQEVTALGVDMQALFEKPWTFEELKARLETSAKKLGVGTHLHALSDSSVAIVLHDILSGDS